MSSENHNNFAAAHHSPRGNKDTTAAITDIEYLVVKQHHRHKWLRQERLLKITSTHVYNCRPPRRNSTTPIVTKQFPLTSITMIGLKGRKAFCIHVRDDHVYYYYSPKAVEIAVEIQRYIAAASAVDIILDSGGGDDSDEINRRRKGILMEQLVSRAILLPGATFSNISERCGRRGYHAIKLRCDLSLLLRRGCVEAAEELNRLAGVWIEKTNYDAIDILQLRQSLTSVRDNCAACLMAENSLLQRGITYSEVVMCVEDIIQKTVLTPNFDKIMLALRMEGVLMDREKLFNKQRKLLRGRSAEIFNVREDLRSIDYKLVLLHFDLLMTLRNPNDILDQLVNIAASLYLTVHVASRFGCLSKSNEGIRVNSGQEESPHSAVRTHSAPPLRTRSSRGPQEREFISSFSDDTEKVRVYEEVKSHEEALLESNSSKPPIVSVNPMKEALAELLPPASPVKDCERYDDAKRSILVLESLSEKSEEKFSSSMSSSFSSHLFSQVRDILPTDDLLPLYIHLLCENDIRDLCFIVSLVEKLGVPDYTSERGYYYTTLLAAMTIVCDWTPEDAEPANSVISDPQKSNLKFEKDGASLANL